MSFRPQLDGLRAVAVIGVAWSHWERPFQFGAPFGAGVHLFFVLSGFLITGILLNVRDAVDRGTAMRAFYIRRSLRIVPAFYLTLLLAWYAELPLVRESIWWHAGYLSNVFTLGRAQWPGTVSHFWSLAVEEQFYLLWPWLIVFAPRRWLSSGILGAIVAAPVSRWGLATMGYPESMWAIATVGCFDSLGVGAWIVLQRPSARVMKCAALASFVGWLTVSLAQASGVAPLALVAIKQTLQAVVFGWIVVRAADGCGGLAGRILSSRPVLYVGRVSYGVYLAHGFAGAMALGLFSLVGLSWPMPEPWRFVVLSVVTVGSAALSWHFFERPLNALKRFFPYAR